MAEKIEIAVISGGLSNEREVSLKTGKEVYDNLSDEQYQKSQIEITSDGRWLLTGGSDGEMRPLAIMDEGINKNDLRQFDVVFLALHGRCGEDGKIQSILDILKIPYTGSGVLASSLGMNKRMASDFAKGFGINAPEYILFNAGDKPDKIKQDVLDKIGYPCVVKPNESGSSIGISLVKTQEAIEEAIEAAFKEDNQILVQEFIEGREITCAVLGNSGQTELEALPPAEVVSANEFFDYEAKYISEKTKEICPAKISQEQTQKVQGLAKMIHEKFGCEGLTRSDFIMNDDDFYFLEINTLPGLTQESLSPKIAKAAGMSFVEFLDKQVKLALLKNGGNRG